MEVMALAESCAKTKEALESKGWIFFGDNQIKGKTKQHKQKPDFVATKGITVIIGEIKSGTEMKSYQSSYRQPQPSDSVQFRRIRADVTERESKGLVEKDVGKHEIVIMGQIKEYKNLAGKTYDFPVDTAGKQIKAGYAVPVNEAENLEKALKNCEKHAFEKIDTGNGMVTYVFDF
jgi:hypothetical protein